MTSTNPEITAWVEWHATDRSLPRPPRPDLTEANLSGADLSGADLSGADLTEANLSGANLSGANLSGANLSGADLIRANLIRANLTGADLRRADLRRANLSWANLSWANLSGANLTGANLRGANLRGAKGVMDPVPGLAAAVLCQITEHPETWNQQDWHCGTAHCAGGWTVLLAGPVGAFLERLYGTQQAATMLLGCPAETFFGSSDDPRPWLAELAAAEETPSL
jgi:hypothetical protein